jgi:hypothetical protein
MTVCKQWPGMHVVRQRAATDRALDLPATPVHVFKVTDCESAV